MNTKHNYNEAKEIEEALPVAGFNVQLSADEEDVFCYLDVVVTTKGEVVNLFA